MGDDFETGKQFFLEGFNTLLNLYVKLALGIGLLGLSDYFGMEKPWDMTIEQARLSKIQLDTFISEISKAQTAAEIRSAIESNKWLGEILQKDKNEST